ncbi:DUF4190 domain-containing protein [Georgenia sp. TF02-10]|uniref:DUF4190 domain-containing protein n=1 Tax=Georgenia sp. TF02-10 TaxID=2917725 RepID=UPI001FA7E905|nr:DUF4190 domain-containing protein [Georgenia sp. TF02-10]UNX54252.1 DUF4190 domain-containing protein [Georgenia sp. TF02-10]
MSTSSRPGDGEELPPDPYSQPGSGERRPPSYGQPGQQEPDRYGQQEPPAYGQQEPQASPGPGQYGQQPPQYGAGTYGQPAGYGQSGYPGQGSYGGGPGQPYGPRNGLGTAALVVAIISLLLAWIPFIGLVGAVGGIVAIILGALGLGRVKRREATNRGVSIAGIVIGALALILAIAATVFATYVIGDVLGPEFQQCAEQYGNDPQGLQRCLEESNAY